MYQKPDFVQVSVKVADVFANYLVTGCLENGFAGYMYSGGSAEACKGKDDYKWVDDTFTGLGLAHQCYTTLNP